MGGNRFFLWGHWYPCLDFWWHLAWVSKPGWIPSLACCVACTQWNSQIHLWCDRCWPFGSQHGGRAILIHVLQALVRLDSGICHATASHYETRQAEALPTDLCWLGFHTDIFALVVLVLTVIAKNVPIFGVSLTVTLSLRGQYERTLSVANLASSCDVIQISRL